MRKKIGLNQYVTFFLSLALGFMVITKLSGKIDIPWLMVFSPLWLPPVAILAVVAVAAIFLAQAASVKALINLFKDDEEKPNVAQDDED